MTPFATVEIPVAPADPRKHVNFELGMVLGVDDFRQEFAYLSGRDKRIVRDLIGGGVVCGLRVTVKPADDERGPSVQVAPGEAVTPSGQLLCVSPAQCAFLNEYLEAHRTEIAATSSPVRLAVVACHRECATDDVPIPGEPCRSEDELMKPSRLLDDFVLELRPEPTAQREEDAVRAFVAWVLAIPLADAPPGDVDAFVDGVRTRIETGGVDPPQPGDPLEYLRTLPPAGLSIPRAAAAAYRTALLRFWADELRARVRSTIPGAECGCGAGGPAELDADADCVTLAELDVPWERDPVSGEIHVPAAATVVVDDARRGVLLHVRLLQEWLLATQRPPEAPPLRGRFSGSGDVVAADGGLTAAQSASDGVYYLLAWPGYDAAASYVVLGQPITADADGAATFEVVPDADRATLFGGEEGVPVRVRDASGAAIKGGFMVRVEEVGA